ncbi:hypothetical protein Sta7437_3237 [Stanieria cyanosphaera PCC 7437]|uniref:Uncharacterized protein n=1 Tax=Stanieria cyanosphaera (strain ATCC 29371 / PCC 7437) TaxID=111780 RepID=K9XXF7_STAC7|nr:hypothetical protein [Stanieria cyanosphaera]AFZ36744.1 hypothetical protein Sta7437_3237 [Stanieria cyanosphaera PCC 7437]
MNLFFGLNNFAVIGLAVFYVFLAGQPSQAETNVEEIQPKANQNFEKKSDSLQGIPAINSNNFQQLTSASNLNNTSTATEVAQTDFEVQPGRTTRSGSSYFGIGGNIGLDGNTAIGDSSFAVISKIGLTENVSFRPSALISGDATFILPLTVDFFTREVEDAEFSVAPYVGGGISLSTGGDTVGVVATGGLDIPISSVFTANAGVNFKFIDDTEIGLLLGLGYNF